jgi:hypothetical protein
MNNLISIVLFVINTIYCITIYYIAKKTNNLLDYMLLPFLFLLGIIELVFFLIQNGIESSWLLLSLFFIQSLTLVWGNKYILRASNPIFDKYIYLWLIFYGIIFICTLFYLQEPCGNNIVVRRSNKDDNNDNKINGGKGKCKVIGWLPFHEHLYKYNFCLLALFAGMYDFTIASQYLYLLIPFTKSPYVTKEQLLRYPLRMIYIFIVSIVVWFYTQYTFNINIMEVGKRVIDISKINTPTNMFSFDIDRIKGIISIYRTFVNPELIITFLYNTWSVFTATYGLIILLHR